MMKLLRLGVNYENILNILQNIPSFLRNYNIFSPSWNRALFLYIYLYQYHNNWLTSDLVQNLLNKFSNQKKTINKILLIHFKKITSFSGNIDDL